MRVLLVHPSLHPPGGGNGLAAWMLQALRDEHDVTLLAWDRTDVETVNRFWGTSLRRRDFRVLRAPWPARLAGAPPLPLRLLKTALMLRVVRREAGRYDVPITGNNETDFGTVGVQYVNYPWNSFPRPAVDLRWYHPAPLLAVYYRLCQALSRFSLEGMRRNVTLVNSDWIGRIIARRYGVPTRTVYPPVAAVSPATPWEVREPGFVCIGRISPEKELDRVMDIVGGVRRTVPAVRLHIVGTPDDRRYYRHVAGRAAAEGVTLHESLTRDALAALVAGQRYGIHGMREEPFGLAPAELARAGCIVWVPNGGGQVEIVAEPRLIYESVDDAVAKIVRTLRDPGEQARLRAHLTGRQPLFSAERFMREIRAAVIEASGRSAASRAAAQEAAVAIARKPGSRASSSS